MPAIIEDVCRVLQRTVHECLVTGSYETARDTVLMGAEWDRKERTWTNPEIIIDLTGNYTGTQLPVG